MIFLFCAVVGMLLAATYVVVYQVFVREVRSSLDARLLEEANLLSAEVTAHPDAAQFSRLSLPGFFFERLSPEGIVLDRSSNLKGVSVRIGALTESKQAQLRTVRTRLGPLRAVVAPTLFAGQREWLLIAEPALGPSQLESKFRERAFGLWTVSLLLTTMIAAWYVGRCLAPIVDLNKHAALLTKRVSEASSQSINARLPVANPRDELGLLAANFNELFAKLDAIVGQLREFVSDAAHELRTPLSVVHGETQFLLVQPRSTDEYQRALRTIDSELTVMVQIIEGLFTLAMADAGQLRALKERIHLDEILEEACGIAAPVARRKEIQIEHGDWAEVEFRGDPALLRQALLILLENATKYSSPGTTISVGIRPLPDRTEIFVADQGIGIAPEHLTYIFQRFYRATPQIPDETRSGGLGLAIAEAILRVHGGSIEVTSEVGRGSIFTLVFPLLLDANASLAPADIPSMRRPVAAGS